MILVKAITASLLLLSTSTLGLGGQVPVSKFMHKSLKSLSAECPNLRPVLEMSRFEAWRDEDGNKRISHVAVYGTSQSWLKLGTSKEAAQGEEISSVCVLCGELPESETLLGDFTLPFRYDQLSSCKTLLSYYYLPDMMLWRMDDVIYYGLATEFCNFAIFADQQNAAKIHEVRIMGRMVDVRDAPASGNHWRRISALRTSLPAPKFRPFVQRPCPVGADKTVSVTNLLGCLVADGSIRLSGGKEMKVAENRRVTFADYDASGSKTSTVQFVEYVASNCWLKVVSMSDGRAPERVLQVSVDIEGYQQAAHPMFCLPEGGLKYRSLNDVGHDLRLVSSDESEYEICGIIEGTPTWLSYRVVSGDYEFNLATLIVSVDGMSPRYRRFSSYIWRSNVRNMRFFYFPGAERRDSRLNWD